MVKMKVIKSHRGDNRTPIIESLYEIIESKTPNENIKGYKEARENVILLDDSLMEKWGIKYPYILPTGAYYSTYYRNSFEFLDISGVFPVRVSYEDLNDYRVRGLRYNRGIDSFFKDEGNIQKRKDGEVISAFNSRLRNLEEFQYQFMTGTEPFQSFYKSNIRSKFHRKDGPLGYLYLTVEDVVKLLSLTGDGGVLSSGLDLYGGGELLPKVGGHESCHICDGDDDIGCECNDGEIPCEECDEGYIECDECGGGGNGICDDCDGNGTLRCEYCEGNGRGGEYGICNECEGDGEIEKECQECEAGSVDCQYCDATGKDEEGEECSDCNGSEKMLCQVCDGGILLRETCEDCDGSGEVGCSNCGEEGDVECDNCEGDGEIEGGCEYCDYGRVECDDCDGSGEQECHLCEGSDYISCIFDENISVYENVDEGLIKEDSGEPFSAYFDWKLNKGNVDARNGVYWVVEKIDFQNWLEADKEELQNILIAWTNDNLYDIQPRKAAFDKISNFSVTYTLATPKGSIGKAIRIHFVFADGVFKVISVDGKLTTGHQGINKMEYNGVIYYSLEDFRFLNWNTLDFNKLKS